MVYSCNNTCLESPLLFKANKQYGETYQQHDARYCRLCAKHFKKEAGLSCPCCNRRMRVRMRTVMARRVRELREKDPLIEHTLKELETIPIINLCEKFLENVHIPFQDRW